MGTNIMWEKGSCALNNCAFVSTKDIDMNPTAPFTFAMDVSMLGVGCGFDTKGEDLIEITFPSSGYIETFVIEDTRESWVDSLGRLLEVFFLGKPIVSFDYSKIRPKGEPIKDFGGVASGPGPLKELHEKITEVLVPLIGCNLSSRAIVDIMNLIACCVVAGNLRRSALLALGHPDDIEYLDLKNYELNPERAFYGWSSNNSVEAFNGLDYRECAKRTEINGEPGYIFLDNVKQYGRIPSAQDWKDFRVEGMNPCSEMGLESFELCNLVEIALNNISSIEEFKKVVKYAYLYAKTITLLPTHIPETNRIMMRNRRIGTSLTGIIQYKSKFGIDNLKNLCEEGYDLIKYYDDIYSDWFCIPKSIKVTTVKPSGTVSLLTGSTPGVHYPKDKYYIRRIRLARSSDLVQPLINAGYKIEPDKMQADTTLVVEFPIFIGENIRIEPNVSIWEQAEMVAFMQQYWADNAVSNTITFNPETEGKDIKNILDFYQYRCKSLSFLPANTSYYPQMPYEKCTKEYYEESIARITELDLSSTSEKPIGEKFCDSSSCLIE